jgi:hypothetical protein
VIILIFLLLNNVLIDLFNYFIINLSLGTGTTINDHVKFPYFLLPSGLPVFFGITALSESIVEPILSIAIFISIPIVFGVLYLNIKYLIAGNAIAAFNIILIGTSFYLYYGNSDFGLFKIALFMQPFILGLIAIYLLDNNSKILYYFFSLILLLNIFNQQLYVQKSTGKYFGGLNEIPLASSEKVNSEFEKLLNNNKSYVSIYSDVSNIVLIKFMSYFTIGKIALFPSKYLGGFQTYELNYNDLGGISTFYINNNSFQALTNGNELFKNSILVSTNIKQDIFNFTNKVYNNYFQVIDKPVNHIIFINSFLGNHYYHGYPGRISFYQLENDPMLVNGNFSALGEYLLFKIMGKTENIRMMFEQTSTVLKQHNSKLPNINVQGNQILFPGYGSARLYTEILDVTRINNEDYIEMKINREGKRFFDNKKFLMNLYGKDVPIDRRLITTFGKQISVVDDLEYKSMKRPNIINLFPFDLQNIALEYSGIYEDGWLSPSGLIILNSEKMKNFIVSGDIPKLKGFEEDFVTLIINIDKKEYINKLSPGPFSVVIPNNQKGNVTIAWKSDTQLKLPGSDGRLVICRLLKFGYE